MRRYLFAAMFAAACCHVAHGQARDARLIIPAPQKATVQDGTRVVQDAILETSITSYTLRYEVVEPAEDTGKVTFEKWGPLHAHDIPLGMQEPSMANWYWQGFIHWTFDGFNIYDTRAEIRAIRESGSDAMVEYSWDTPRVRAWLRFAVTSGSDKLLMFAGYEPKEEITNVVMRLTAYPDHFEEPRKRTATTALRTLTEGGAILDPAKERWVLLEDVGDTRTGSGSAGLLLGDASAFSRMSVDNIGGYPEHVTLTLKPDRRQFALGFYEFPDIRDFNETREYFRRSADAESDALAELNSADLDQPLPPLPVDAQRTAQILAKDDTKIDRPAERWTPNPEPLSFPWAARMPGEPVRTALLAARFAAFDTMELARRLEMDVLHQYFDGKGTLSDIDAWPYSGVTGVGALGSRVATRALLRICEEPRREVFLIAGVTGTAIPEPARDLILDRVRAGKGLFVSTASGKLDGWPADLTATPDDALIAPALEAIPCDAIPGFALGDPARVGDIAPLRGFRYGAGRVVVFTGRLNTYCGLLPKIDRTFGLDAAEDRILALQGLAVLAAGGRSLPSKARIIAPDAPIAAGKPADLAVQTPGPFASALVRIQDDHGTLIAESGDLLDRATSRIALPALPAGRRYYVDLLLRNAGDECLAFASQVVDVAPAVTIESVSLSPAKSFHETGPPLIDLPDGGLMTCDIRVAPADQAAGKTVYLEARDCVGRLVAQSSSMIAEDGASAVQLEMPRPVAVAHELECFVYDGDTPLAVERRVFTMPVPYPYEDFTYLMWSYPGGDLPVRVENRLCYEMGTDMMDLCHMRGYTDAGAAREYALASMSGQRLVPYVTRIAGEERPDNTLVPSLFSEEWIEHERQSMQVASRQAAPYQPPAYTLGDENYMSHGRYEVEVSPASMKAFREWLRDKYENIDALNAVWDTDHADFDAITKPMLLDEALQQPESCAPWFDFRAFMDSAFAGLHQHMAGFVRAEDPGAKVGWDGFLGYHWGAGYDFYKLTRDLELNQCYTSGYLQGELIRSLKEPGALTGEWGNAVADREDGFTAIGWHNLFRGHNSCWWWTSWGCDYIPFNPDMTVSDAGRWYFNAAREIKSGPGRLLLHATREDSSVLVLYNQADLYAQVLATRLRGGSVWDGGHEFENNLSAISRALQDAGYPYRFLAAAELETNPDALKDCRLFVLPQAMCLSDTAIARIRQFVQAGGMLLADGRAGLLTGDGALRETRPLDDVFGISSPSGSNALSAKPTTVKASTGPVALELPLLETVRATFGETVANEPGAPTFIANAFGAGQTMWLNFPFATYNKLRVEANEWVFAEMLRRFLGAEGLGPAARITSPTGPVRCIQPVTFADEDLRYLALQQDILIRGLPEQSVRVEMRDSAYVYDVRAGELVSHEPTSTWDTTISRGTPRLFALLPYRVTGLSTEVTQIADPADAPEDFVRNPDAAASIAPGQTVQLGVRVSAAVREPGFHVVHLSVFAPGSDREHREYSRNIDCPAGAGTVVIPFALNDPDGIWRLVFTDAATGVESERQLTLAR